MKDKLLISRIVLFLILAIVFTGCTGGGGGTSDDSAAKTEVLPSVQVLPSVYDFGIVTLGNTPVPLEAKIQNNGSANLKVSDIVLSDTDNFALDLGGGSNPCSSTSPTISAGDNCTVEVTFTPQLADSFEETLQIKSNDSSNPNINIQLSGSDEPIASLDVRINQVESDMQCPAAKVTAYVSVTDQGGYAVTGLLENNFLVYEDIDVMNLTDFSFVSQVTAPISVALVMDYSGSITAIPEVQSDMEEAVAYFVDQLGTDDEADNVKFATEIEVVQGFTSDKNLLTNAIFNPVDVGSHTSLYDAAWQAVDDTALRLKTRKAVIIVSDGEDDDGTGNPISSSSLSDVINHANDKGVPIFTVGLGNINNAVLEQMSNETGGIFFDSPTSDNLGNIYSQIAKALFKNQYILTYVSALGVDVTANLTIEAYVSQTIMGDDTKEIIPCP
jgi:Ca-activated chloride channel family protein